MADTNGWTLETRRRPPYEVRDLVRHRGHTYPKGKLVGRFTSDGDPPLVVVIEIEMRKREGPFVTRLSIEGNPIGSRDLRRLPVPELAKLLAKRHVVTSIDDPAPAVHRLRPVLEGDTITIGPIRGRRAYTDEEFAAKWRAASDGAAAAEGRSVGAYLAEELGLSESRVYSLTSEIRKKRPDLIPPRKGKQKS